MGFLRKIWLFSCCFSERCGKLLSTAKKSAIIRSECFQNRQKGGLIIKKIIKWCCIALTIAILIFLALCLTRYHARQDALSAHLEELKAQANTYEAELQDIRDEMEEKEKEVSDVYEIGTVLIGYHISSVDALEEANGILLLNCGAETELINAAVESGQELILTCSTFDEKLISEVKTLTNAKAFLLPSRLDTTARRETLYRLGFSILVRYLKNTKTFLGDNSVSLLPYQVIKSTSFDLTSRLDDLTESCESVLFILNGSLSQEDCQQITDTIQTYIQNNKLQSRTLEEMDEYIRNADKLQEQKQAEYESYCLQQQARIDRLNNLIQNIYRNWANISDNS